MLSIIRVYRFVCGQSRRIGLMVSTIPMLPDTTPGSLGRQRAGPSPAGTTPAHAERGEVNATPRLNGTAVIAALTMPFASGAQAGPAPKPTFDAEKCYGVSKAAKNDCQTANSSCAGTARR